MPTETLPSPTPTTPGAQPAPKATPQGGAAPTANNAPGVDAGARQADNGKAPAAGPATMTPEEKRAARQAVARQIAGRSAGSSSAGQAGGGQQGGIAGTVRPGDGTPQAGVSPTTPTPKPTTTPAAAGGTSTPADQPAAAPAGLHTYGKLTGLTEEQLRQATKLGERMRLELGPIGERLAEGEALSPTDVLALAEHVANRASKLAAQPGKNGTAKAPVDAGSGSSQPTTRRPSRQPQTSPTAAGGTDGLDSVLADLALVDEDKTKQVRSHVEELQAQLADATEKLTTFERQRAEERADQNAAAAMQACASDYPELNQPGVLASVLEQLEEFDPDFSRAAEGGPGFLRLFKSAASLVILPTRHQGIRADLLQRTAAERAGAPVQPQTTVRPEKIAPMTALQGRQAIARAQMEIQDPDERRLRIEAIKAAVQK